MCSCVNAKCVKLRNCAPQLFWPYLQGRLRKAQQIVAACAIDRLHGHPLVDSSDKTGKVGGIRIIGKITFGFGSFKPFTQVVLPFDSQGNQFSADWFALYTTDEGCLDRHTSVSRSPLGQKLCRAS